MEHKIQNITDFLGPVFSISGFTVAQTDYLETVFLVLTIVSISVSLISRLYHAVKRIKTEIDEAMEDNKLTKEELDDIATSVLNEYNAIAESEEVDKLKEVIKTKEKK
ncbi:MAG: hypothetical protein BWX74_00961 [Tenericutes bacterium ADurb.Bin087]|nr:MAG: hypothetical protein BWX74_00961 [Tenericutes bacterium ADurb.Bin087]